MSSSSASAKPLSPPPEHFLYGASTAHRWMSDACPGCIRHIAGRSSPESEHARRGTAAHSYAELCLKQNLDPVEHFNSVSSIEINVKGKFVTLDEEDAEAVKVYVDLVNSYRKLGFDIFIEHKFDLRERFKKPLGGTADCVVYDPKTKTLYVIDYKHGAGKMVKVRDNRQLKYYALATLLTLGLLVDKVISVVVQPRCLDSDAAVRSACYDVIDMLEFQHDIVESVELAESPDAPLRVGEWCQFCPGEVDCPEKEKQRNEVAKMEFTPVNQYSPEKLRAALDMIPSLESWISAVHEYAYAEAMKGRPPLGHKLVEKRANRKWVDDAIAVSFLKSCGLTDDDIYTRKLKSPAQAKKLVKTMGFKLDESIVKKESSGLTLVPETDNRAAVRILDAVAEFSAITKEEN